MLSKPQLNLIKFLLANSTEEIASVVDELPGLLSTYKKINKLAVHLEPLGNAEANSIITAIKQNKPDTLRRIFGDLGIL